MISKREFRALSRTEKTYMVLEEARERLHDERVMKALGKRGELLCLVADVARVGEVFGDELLPFPDYESQDIFPVIMMDPAHKVVSTMVNRMPIQTCAVEEYLRCNWDMVNELFSESDIQLTLEKTSQTSHLFHMLDIEKRIDGRVSLPFKAFSYSDEKWPFMISRGRPHIALREKVV